MWCIDLKGLSIDPARFSSEAIEQDAFFGRKD